MVFQTWTFYPARIWRNWYTLERYSTAFSVYKNIQKIYFLLAELKQFRYIALIWCIFSYIVYLLLLSIIGLSCICFKITKWIYYLHSKCTVWQLLRNNWFMQSSVPNRWLITVKLNAEVVEEHYLLSIWKAMYT